MAMEAGVATRRLFTVEQFHRMARAGVFAPDERVELIDGEVLQMSPIGDPHAARTGRATRVFGDRFGTNVIVWVQNPLRLGGRSEAYPDVAVLRYRDDFYEGAAPTAADVLLILEVSDTTRRFDLGTKARLYARHGIPDYWVEDIKGDRVIVHRDPTPTGYETVRTLHRGESIQPVSFPGEALAVAELLG